jgi:HEAT repeat protein
MRRFPALLCAAALAVLLPGRSAAQAPSGAAPPDTSVADQAVLRGAGVGVDGPSLLKYFADRTFAEANPRRMAVLIALLGSDTFTAREKAYRDILDLGDSALFALRLAENHPDTEVQRRVAELRQHIEAKADPVLQGATARLIAVRKPAGAAAVVLAFLPFAADDSVVDELRKTLTSVAVRDGMAESVVVQALGDKVALKRASAAEALARAGAKDQLPAVRQLLKDADPLVRLRVALALVSRKEKDAVTPLIDTFAFLPPEQLWPAEEILVRLAGDQAPQVSLGSEEITRKSCRDAWRTWWQKHQDKIDLAKLDQPQAVLGYTLLVQFNFNRVAGGQRFPAMGQVLELDGAQSPKVRWSFDVPTYPVAAQVVAPDRVLVAEYQGARITERDFKGNIKWEKAVGGNPINAQRLPNGNTFVVMQNLLLELDRNGKQVFALQRPHDIFRARKLPGGDVVFVTNVGMLSRVDSRTQKEVKSFNVGQIGNLFGNIDVLPNGNVIVPQYQANQVVEFGADGRQVWSARVAWPTSVARLPNGHTLVASQNNRRIVELDRAGREVWTHSAEGMVFQATRR